MTSLCWMNHANIRLQEVRLAYCATVVAPMMHPRAGQDIHRFIFETSSQLRNAGDPERVLRRGRQPGELRDERNQPLEAKLVAVAVLLDRTRERVRQRTVLS